MLRNEQSNLISENRLQLNNKKRILRNESLSHYLTNLKTNLGDGKSRGPLIL